MEIIKCKEITNLIDECERLLDANVRIIDGKKGFHQHLGSNKIGYVATSMVLIYNYEVGREKNYTSNCLQTILEGQNEDGGWAYVTSENQESNVDATCWSLQCLNLYKSENENISKALDLGVEWLLNIIIKKRSVSHSDVGWGFSQEGEQSIVLTCRVLQTLIMLGRIDSEVFHSAFKWLLSTQQEDGGWGFFQMSRTDLYSTSYAMYIILTIGRKDYEEYVDKALKYLETNLLYAKKNKDIYFSKLVFIEENSQNKKNRLPYFYYPLPMTLQTLILHGKKKELIVKYCKELVSQYVNKNFQHPMISYKKIIPIWNIIDIAKTLSMFKHFCGKWNKKSHIIGFLEFKISIKKRSLFSYIFNIPTYVWRYLLGGGLLSLFLYSMFIIDTVEWLELFRDNHGIWYSLICSFLPLTVSKVFSLFFCKK